MGYKRGALVLEWPEDSEFSGLEVRMKRLSVEQLLKVEKLSDLKESNSDDTAEVFADLLDTVGKGLLSWNYEDDDDQPIPATRESLTDVDAGMILALVQAWTRAAAAVPLDSKPSSPTGVPEPPDDEWASYLATNQESLPAPASS